eukprot:GDKI01033777.1.p1 GENE.GDKI01033777.1~~GDKI01033777.1.p1  ORF type:complete len:146 (-),score=5.82 GDKI01033777.1:34-471(-)
MCVCSVGHCIILHVYICQSRHGVGRWSLATCFAPYLQTYHIHTHIFMHLGARTSTWVGNGVFVDQFCLFVLVCLFFVLICACVCLKCLGISLSHPHQWGQNRSACSCIAVCRDMYCLSRNDKFVCAFSFCMHVFVFVLGIGLLCT